MGVVMDKLTGKMEENAVEAIDILSARVDLTVEMIKLQQEEITQLTNVVNSQSELINAMYNAMHSGK